MKMDCPFKELCKEYKEECKDEKVIACEKYMELHTKDALFTFNMLKKHISKLYGLRQGD